VRFVFAGDGELRGTVEARIRTLGIERNVVLTGFHPHPEQLIALADVCLIASSREGLPRVLMQSLAGGTPVIAADLPSIDEVLRHDVNGLIVRSDLEGLADAVIGLLDDPARLARLARSAAATPSPSGTRRAWASGWRPSTRRCCASACLSVGRATEAVTLERAAGGCRPEPDESRIRMETDFSLCALSNS
jgi:glycosyltransferase involved in cell wall biosynthesis